MHVVGLIRHNEPDRWQIGETARAVRDFLKRRKRLIDRRRILIRRRIDVVHPVGDRIVFAHVLAVTVAIESD